MIKRFISLLLSLCLFISYSTICFAANEEPLFHDGKDYVYYNQDGGEVSVFLDGNKIEFDVLPTIANGRTLVPMRAIFEAMGAVVEWNGEQQSITVTRGNQTIWMGIGDYNIYGEKIISLDVPPVLYNGRTLVPLRAISEAFYCDVVWDGNTRSVYITTNDANNDSYKYAIKSKNDFIKYVKEYGTKKDSYYYVSSIDDNGNKIFSYYFVESDTIMIGYNVVNNTGVFDLVYLLKEDGAKATYNGNYYIIQGTNTIEYTFDGSYKAIDINKYYTPIISTFTVTVNNADLTGKNFQNDKEAKELLQTMIIDSLITSVLSAANEFNLYIGEFGFTSIFKTDNPTTKQEIVSSEDNNALTYETEYNALLEWADEKTQEIYAEGKEIYDETYERKLKEAYAMYGIDSNSDPSSFAYSNAMRQVNAMIPNIKAAAEIEKSAYEAENLETLAYYLQTKIKELKAKYNIK